MFPATDNRNYPQQKNRIICRADRFRTAFSAPFSAFSPSTFLLP